MQQRDGVDGEHTYHVLESPHHQVSTNGGGSKERALSVLAGTSSTYHEIPIYQDIKELSMTTSMETTSGQVATVTCKIEDRHEYRPISKLDPKLVVPVYQVIDELNRNVEQSNCQGQDEMPAYEQIHSSVTSI